MQHSKNQKDELSDQLRTEEGQKQKKLIFKSKLSKKGKNHKCKDYNTLGGVNEKIKFSKEIKTDNGLRLIISMMATKEQNNQALISALSTHNS